MFLLTDSQITNERFLIYINDLLASGNIPDLFAVDEVDAIVSGNHRTRGCFGRIVWCAICIPNTVLPKVASLWFCT